MLEIEAEMKTNASCAAGAFYARYERYEKDIKNPDEVTKRLPFLDSLVILFKYSPGNIYKTIVREV
jgi:hypothetical protein